MRFEVLGPLRVGDGSVQVSARRERVLLAMLLLHAGEVVPVERLVEAVWADRPPREATGQLHSAVYRLRKRLAGEVVVTEPGGYRIRVDADDLDLRQFRRQRDAARAASEPQAAAGRYRQALQLWRGPALADIDSPVVRRAAAALDEERVQAQQECVEVELALGRAGELIAELIGLVQQHPYREGLHAALMRALYKAGRQADALAAYRRLRQLMHDELGTEPSGELQCLHQAILNRDPQLAAPASAPATDTSTTPRELPADVAGFTGRDGALKTLDGMLSQQAGPVVITAIAGTAGVGKTALAVHWAHRVADRFPDGQLYLNLRGYATDAPLSPIGALAAMLRSLGVPPQQIPTDEAHAAAMYRTRLADKRALVVLDNAGTVGQVRPLLPGSPGCLVLITSRDRLAGLVARDGAHRLTLDVLTPDESATLLTHLLGQNRTANEPEAAAELARACAHLPLALRIAAAHLTDRPELSTTDYLTELTREGLEALRIEGDDDGAIQATFDLSYQRLSAEARRLLRLLGLVPGPSVTPPAVAALTGTGGNEADRLLHELATAHLVEEQSVGRFSFHDLIRRYAADRASNEETISEREAALTRLYDHYLKTADAAAGLAFPALVRLPRTKPGYSSGSTLFTNDPATARAWLDAERPNLVAATLSAGPKRGPWVWQIADHLRGYFYVGRYRNDWELVARAALAASEAHGDRHATSASQLSLAQLRMSQYAEADAIIHAKRALESADDAGWMEGRAAILSMLGTLQLNVGQLDQAAEHLTQAIAQVRRMGARAQEAGILGNLTTLYCTSGRLADARDVAHRALALNVECGSRNGEAVNLCLLGEISRLAGELNPAREYLTRAKDIFGSVGNQGGQSASLADLADVYRDLGEYTQAAESARLARILAQQSGYVPFECASLITQASIKLRLQRYDEAIDHYEHAVELASRVMARYQKADALIGLAMAYLHANQHEKAHRRARQAIIITRKGGYRLLEGEALTVLAVLALTAGMPEEAVEPASKALTIHQETGYRIGEARTQLVIGEIQDCLGNHVGSTKHHDHARTLFTYIGAAVEDEAALLPKRTRQHGDAEQAKAGPGRRDVRGRPHL